MNTAIQNAIRLNLMDSIEFFYLDYFNNFISVQAFADHYGISKHLALIVIEKGKLHNNSR